MCLFCDDKLVIMERGKRVICFFDNFPVTKYHMLFVPVRHVNTYFDLSKKEIDEIDHFIIDWSKKLQIKDPNITGFNIGWNCGESAGQTIGHAHCHLIPRRDGDIDNPIGGVRGVIPDKRLY